MIAYCGRELGWKQPAAIVSNSFDMPLFAALKVQLPWNVFEGHVVGA